MPGTPSPAISEGTKHRVEQWCQAPSQKPSPSENVRSSTGPPSQSYRVPLPDGGHVVVRPRTLNRAYSELDRADGSGISSNPRPLDASLLRANYDRPNPSVLSPEAQENIAEYVGATNAVQPSQTRASSWVDTRPGNGGGGVQQHARMPSGPVAAFTATSSYPVGPGREYDDSSQYPGAFDTGQPVHGPSPHWGRSGASSSMTSSMPPNRTQNWGSAHYEVTATPSQVYDNFGVRASPLTQIQPTGCSTCNLYFADPGAHDGLCGSCRGRPQGGSG